MSADLIALVLQFGCAASSSEATPLTCGQDTDVLENGAVRKDLDSWRAYAEVLDCLLNRGRTREVCPVNEPARILNWTLVLSISNSVGLTSLGQAPRMLTPGPIRSGFKICMDV